MPPMTNMASEDSHIPPANRAKPTRRMGTLRRSSDRLAQPLVAIWAPAAAANAEKATAPATAWDVTCRVPIKKLGTSELNTPNTAKAARPAKEAGKKQTPDRA